jgi:uncharacterized protein (TIGR02391 family)
MDFVEPFSPSQLEAICKSIGDTNLGLKGSEIEYILREIRVADPDPSQTKWRRIFNALASVQNMHKVGNHTLMFLNKAMALEKYVSDPDLFKARQDNLNLTLSFCGYVINDSGKVARRPRETTLQGAIARAGTLKKKLENRGTHEEVFKYCRAELLTENYYHATLEAVKGLASRLRVLSGLSSDGAELANTAFAVKNPILVVNSLSTETEISEQKGISNLFVGLFGAIRNPIAHAPRTEWAMLEQDAIDIFALISYLHRKLDISQKR